MQASATLLNKVRNTLLTHGPPCAGCVFLNAFLLSLGPLRTGRVANSQHVPQQEAGRGWQQCAASPHTDLHSSRARIGRRDQHESYSERSERARKAIDRRFEKLNAMRKSLILLTPYLHYDNTT